MNEIEPTCWLHGCIWTTNGIIPSNRAHTTCVAQPTCHLACQASQHSSGQTHLTMVFAMCCGFPVDLQVLKILRSKWEQDITFHFSISACMHGTWKIEFAGLVLWDSQTNIVVCFEKFHSLISPPGLRGCVFSSAGSACNSVNLPLQHGTFWWCWGAELLRTPFKTNLQRRFMSGNVSDDYFPHFCAKCPNCWTHQSETLLLLQEATQ